MPSEFAGHSCILALERVLSETRLLWSGTRARTRSSGRVPSAMEFLDIYGKIYEYLYSLFVCFFIQYALMPELKLKLIKWIH